MTLYIQQYNDVGLDTACTASETSALQSSSVAKHIVWYGYLYIAVQQLCFLLPCSHCMAFGELSSLVSPSTIYISLILQSLSQPNAAECGRGTCSMLRGIPKVLTVTTIKVPAVIYLPAW